MGGGLCGRSSIFAVAADGGDGCGGSGWRDGPLNLICCADVDGQDVAGDGRSRGDGGRSRVAGRLWAVDLIWFRV